MADKKISDFTEATTVDPADLLEIENTGGNSRKVLARNLASGVAIAIYEDQKAANTAGGGSTSGSWQTRTLNTEVSDSIGITLASNQMTLPAGTYEADAITQLYRTDRARCRLQDVTNGVTLLLSDTCYTPSSTSGSQVVPRCLGRFTLAGSAAVELQYRVQTSTTTNGLGVESNFSVTEVYSRVKLTRIS